MANKFFKAIIFITLGWITSVNIAFSQQEIAPFFSWTDTCNVAGEYTTAQQVCNARRGWINWPYPLTYVQNSVPSLYDDGQCRDTSNQMLGYAYGGYTCPAGYVAQNVTSDRGGCPVNGQLPFKGDSAKCVRVVQPCLSDCCCGGSGGPNGGSGAGGGSGGGSGGGGSGSGGGPGRGLGGSGFGVGNPINAATGNKYQVETDYVSSGASPLMIQRKYNSVAMKLDSNYASTLNKLYFASNWRHNYQGNIAVNSNNVLTTAVVFRPNGNQIYFNLVGGLWKAEVNVNDQLLQTSTGWQYIVGSDNTLENYNTTGQLVSLTYRNGSSLYFTYTGGRLSRVQDDFGKQLNYTYDTSGRIATITNPEGGVYTYTYSTGATPSDALNKLISVSYPDSTPANAADNPKRTYVYNEQSNTANTYLPTALTGIINENGARYATYKYNANGLAIVTQHAGTVDKYSLAYTMNGAVATNTVVTDPRNNNYTYNFQTTLGLPKLSSQIQPAGAGTATKTIVYTYDANGNLASRRDFNGNKTNYVYDLVRNVETSRTEGLTSAGVAVPGITRTITTGWHPTLRLHTLVEEFAGATATGTPTKRTSYAYDNYGNLTQMTETDPVRSIDRTTTITYTYSSVIPGLVLSKVVDGPRTDVSDITTYTYYPHDASCAASTGISTVTNLGCRGQLQSITNALNQTTQYTRYNHHSQVEEIVDSNGLVTTNTYDLRQRLLSRVVGNEATTLQYDAVGQVTLMTMPDSSTLAYTYDAAQRLTKVTDGLGNHVDYTLDAEGNRIEEKTYDPNGNLAKTLTRSYDALNRLQALTGVAQE